MSKSQPRRSRFSLPMGAPERPEVFDAQRLHKALSEYRVRHAPGHARAVREILGAVDATVDAMRSSGQDCSAIIVSLKALLAEYPASALIHPDAVRRGIERYYAPQDLNASSGH